MPPTTLRTAQPADAAVLAGLALQVFLDTYCPSGLRADLTAEALATGDPGQWQRLLADRARHSLLLEHPVDGEAHGIGLATLRLDGTQAELERLYLHPRFQRQGEGRRLLTCAEETAAAAGATRLWLDCWSGNTGALAFYAACGYADQGESVYAFGGRHYANRRLSRQLNSIATRPLSVHPDRQSDVA